MDVLRRFAIGCAALGVAVAASAAPDPEDGGWRGARWGMTEEEVLAAFPGEARRLEKPQKLADGNTVGIGIDRHVVGGTELRVRFVFDPGGKLALVSLRTDAGTYAPVAAFEATRDALAARLGPPAATSADANYVDMRQASWWTAQSRVDVKYIPGVVVVLYSPTDGGPPARAAVPPLLARPPGGAAN